MRALSEEQERALIKAYEEGYTADELSIEHRVSKRTVWRTLARYGVPRQVKSGSIRLRRVDKKKPKPKALKPCGTNAAYQRHRYRKEYPCTPCLEAHAANVLAAKIKKRKKARDL